LRDAELRPRTDESERSGAQRGDATSLSRAIEKTAPYNPAARNTTRFEGEDSP